MKRRHRNIALPGSSRRKWARRGRAVGDFATSLLFSVSEGIVDFGIYCSKRTASGISAMRRRKAAAQSNARGKVLKEEPMFRSVDKREVENVTFDDVVGLEKAKRQIMQRVILPLRHRDKARILKIAKGGGMLLIGPPGNGKTMLAKAVANEVNAVFFHIKPSDIIRHSMGVSANRISELFRILRRYRLAVLFMDDVDGLIRSRSSSSVIMNSIITQYLVETDGLESSSGDNILLIIAATNKPEVIDEATKRYGRFDEQIFIGLPGINARELILRKNMEDVPASEGIDFRHLAERARLFSGADLKGLVDKAKQRTFDRSIRLKGRNTVSAVSMEDFEVALGNFGPSVSRSELQKYGVKFDDCS